MRGAISLSTHDTILTSHYDTSQAIVPKSEWQTYKLIENVWFKNNLNNFEITFKTIFKKSEFHSMFLKIHFRKTSQ